MYTYKEYKEGELTVVELSNHNSWLKVVPERGGIITSLGFAEEELLFLNEETLHDKEKNIRGGIPILFPISGQLTNGEYEWEGQIYQMENHGFARDLPWEVVTTDVAENEASITLKLESNKETLSSYPFEFSVLYTYKLRPNELIIEQFYENHSTSDMPIYPGFHPYFKTKSKQLKITADSDEYLDYNDLLVKKYENVINVDQKEAYVLKSKAGHVEFLLEELNKQVKLQYDDEFSYIVLWSEEGQEFVCVEPWMAKTDELNRKEELTMINPGKTLHTKVSISI
ncbi:aldose epimerase [Metabacillus litoralis]|uniref:aldose epimerase family protein n=1 Tax=Metabacillus litoralis TaxID=152268 RepID=UPI001CFD5538|nr:aldose epimerase [Metabacillus litoralis]